MTERDKGWWTVMDLRQRNNDEVLKEIAELLREGYSEQEFLDLLADLIDPTKTRNMLGLRLVVEREKGGAPQSERNRALENFMEIHVDFFGEELGAVVIEACKRFGVGAQECNEALKFVRNRRDPGHFDRTKKLAWRLRELGHPDYQPS